MRRFTCLAVVALGLALALAVGRVEMVAQQATPAVIVSGDVSIDQTKFGNTDQLPRAAFIKMARRCVAARLAAPTSVTAAKPASALLRVRAPRLSTAETPVSMG